MPSIIDESKDDPICAAGDKMLVELERLCRSQRMKFAYVLQKCFVPALDLRHNRGSTYEAIARSTAT